MSTRQTASLIVILYMKIRCRAVPGTMKSTATDTENEDEDDHDVAAPRIFDLAIKKERETSVPSYSYTQNVKYTITVLQPGQCGCQVRWPSRIPYPVDWNLYLPSIRSGRSWTHKISRVINTPWHLPPTQLTNYILVSIHVTMILPMAGPTILRSAVAIAADGGSNADIDGVFDSNLKMIISTTTSTTTMCSISGYCCQPGWRQPWFGNCSSGGPCLEKTLVTPPIRLWSEPYFCNYHLTIRAM